MNKAAAFAAAYTKKSLDKTPKMGGLYNFEHKIAAAYAKKYLTNAKKRRP